MSAGERREGGRGEGGGGGGEKERNWGFFLFPSAPAPLFSPFHFFFPFASFCSFFFLLRETKVAEERICDDISGSP